MNVFTVYGRISTDVELRYSQGDTPLAVISFNVAVKRNEGEGSDFFPFIAFGKRAECIEKYFQKGSRIAMRCHAKRHPYSDKNGNKRSEINFIVDEIYFIDSKAEKERYGKGQEEGAASAGAEWMNIPDGIDQEQPFR